MRCCRVAVLHPWTWKISENSMAFYARPQTEIFPGDISPSIPFPVVTAPLKIARPLPYTPKAGKTPVDSRRIHTMPDATLINSKLEISNGEDALAKTRCSKAIFLTWGSDVDSDELRITEHGKVGKRGWLAAPVYDIMQEIPEGSVAEDPDTHVKTSVRDLIRQGKLHQSFYLPPFPGVEPATDHYANLRQVTNIGVDFFRQAKAQRLATLTRESYNELITQLVWVFSRAELLFRPIRCECGREVTIDQRFEGQMVDLEEYE